MPCVKPYNHFLNSFRLKLTSAPEATAASLLPPKQRLKLFQPRSKLEQFEDILLESQLLEASLAGGGSASFSDIVSAADNLMSSNPQALTMAGLPVGPGGYPGMSFENIDFDTSDIIFGDKTSTESNIQNSKTSAKIELKLNRENNHGSTLSSENKPSNVTKGKIYQIKMFLELIHKTTTHCTFNSIFR